PVLQQPSYFYLLCILCFVIIKNLLNGRLRRVTECFLAVHSLHHHYGSQRTAAKTGNIIQGKQSILCCLAVLDAQVFTDSFLYHVRTVYMTGSTLAKHDKVFAYR